MAEVSPLIKKGKWFKRKSVVRPTWRVWLIILGILGLGTWWILTQLHGWLSPVRPEAGAKYIIVEGWAPDYVVEQAQELARDQSVIRVFTTGIPLEAGSYFAEEKNYAQIAAKTLASMGIDPQRICPVPCGAAKTERTLAMARALKEVIDAENIPEADRRINLITLGAHSRRSWGVFQKVLGPTWKVGIIAVPNEDYEAEAWFKTSGGIRAVTNEVLALLIYSLTGK